ncbi:MAG: PilZ domain-containing protein [Deltaproteobacteria bacterium]|nr:PilZ domain-containing protein [Deltaproteobacteria bacterium]MBW1952017.1 PilZ domain-containing protein [Deltaproteobacteria bacterium]MBW1986081.1 PilZ domain-containing protein [Deltaproteobacteria bacterium]MBW2134233.1 PilZ domain-containing protein [Deltaproteobacteria bacterium]
MRRPKPRRSRRYLIQVELLELNNKPGAGNYLRDLSAMGARLETATSFVARTPVEFTFILPGEEEAMRLGGQVVWARPVIGKLSRYLVGVKLFQTLWELDLWSRRWEGLQPK